MECICKTEELTFSLLSAQIRPHDPFQPDWILGILLLSFMLLAWSQYFHRKRLGQLLQAPFQKRHLSLLVREGNLFAERISVTLGIIYFLVVPLLLYQVNDMILKKTPGNLRPVELYAILVGILLAYWLVKYFLVRMLDSIFRTYQTAHEYLLNILVVNFITGIVLLPMVLLTVYLKSPVFLYISVFLFGFSFLVRFIRGFLIGISLTKFSYLFLFVYL